MSKIIPKCTEKRNKGVHLLYNSPMAGYQQIKNSDAFSLQPRIKLPSKLYGEKKKKASPCAEHRNLRDN